MVSALCSILWKDLDSYTPSAGVSNFCHFDRMAFSWLRRHSGTVMVCDADKGMGDILLERTWVFNTSMALVREACDGCNSSDAAQLHTSCQMTMLAIADRYRYFVFDDKTWDLILANTTSTQVGKFRLRPKIHKNPMGARPIFNLGNSALKNTGILLCKIFSPLQAQCNYVLNSTDHLLERIKLLGDVNWDNYELFVSDISNLYPSVNRVHLMSTLRTNLCRLYGHTSKSACSMALLKLCMDHQLVTFNGCTYRVTRGIATGFASGVFLANCYLDDLDKAVAEMDCTLFWGRLCDHQKRHGAASGKYAQQLALRHKLGDAKRRAFCGFLKPQVQFFWWTA